ncbi:kelch domain protein [Myxococcus hansupus]|uniref:Kelch domain protein n=1 Tax=Pseudomyxococcus hansupus TaxID=1297742 RepID=A0A0H4X3H6_9BACT|nr:kelch domain protein [Myxococcus hansupus]
MFAAACFALTGVMGGCAEEAPFAVVPDALVRPLTVDRSPQREGRGAARLSDGRWLLLGGETSSRDSVIQGVDGALEPLIPGLRHARSHATATVLPDGRILVTGGRDASGRLVATSEWFSLERRAFADEEALRLEPRARHTATVLTDGRVLITGGETSDARDSDTAELMDPRTLMVTRLPSRMQVARAGHTAVLLPDGRVLLWGGDAPGATPTAELFDPARETFLRVDAAELERLPKPNAALAVAGSLPADRAISVPVNTLLAVRLSQPVSEASGSTVSLMGPVGSVAGRHTLAESGRLLFFLPTKSLLPATAYTLYAQGLKGEGGLELPLTTVGFTTASLAPGEARPDARLPRPRSSRAQAKAQPVASLRATERRLPDGRYEWLAPERPFFDDGETWLPGPEHFTGNWRSSEPQVEAVEPLTAAPGITALSGRVLRLNGQPLAGVRIVVHGVATVTDAKGRFLVEGLNQGGQTLEVNGQTANHGDVRYGLFFMHVDVKDGVTNPLGHTVWMPRLDPQGTVSIPSPTTEDVTVTTPAIPGLELRLPPGTVVRDREGNLLTEINITPLPINQTPFPLPNLDMPLYFTLQPGDARFEGLTPGFSGAKLYYPNYRGELPGARANFWNYDANGSGWHAYGLGSVSADGRQVIPDDGVALYGFVGAGFTNPDAPPPPVGGGCNTECCGLGGGGAGGGGDCGGGSAGSPGSLTGGDPVQLSSGQFLFREVDLSVADLIPLRVERTYRSLDLTRRQFGVGMTSDYERFLWRSSSDFTEYELVNPDGTRIRYERISPGTGASSAVFATTYPGPWAGSRIVFNTELQGWDLSFRDGRRWTFNHAHRLERMTDRNGNVVTLTRQNGNSGPITRITGPSGRYVEFTNGTGTQVGLVLQAKDHAGRIVTYAYDPQGRLTHVTDATGAVRRYTYNTSNYMETVVDAEDRLVVQNEYGTKGRISKQTLSDGSTYEFTYVMSMISQCLPNGPCNVREGDQVNVADIKDRSGQTRRVTFYSGYIIYDAYPLGTPQEQVTAFELAPSNGRRTAKIDPQGRRTEFEHDAHGNLTKVTRLAGTPQAFSLEYTYTADNQVATFKDGLGHITRYHYNSQGSLNRLEDATGRNVEYSYDSHGRVRTMRAGTEEPITLTYEGADLVAVTDGAGRTTEFLRDALGRAVARRGPGGQVDRYEYDAHDRLTRHTNALGHVTVFTYDKTGRFTRVRDPRGKETLYSYNALGLLAERMDPLGRTEAYTYDSAGRAKNFQDRKGQVSGWAYDSLGRLVLKGFGATPATPEDYTSTISYEYDTVGRLSRIEDSLGPVTTFTYDVLNRPLQQVSSNGTIDSTYDVAGRLTSMGVSGQAQSTYAYDAAGRLTSIAQDGRTVSFTYDAAGRRTSVTLPGGASQHYSYSDGRLKRIEYRQGTTFLGDLTYTFDLNGDLVSVGGTYARTGLPDAVSGMTYDAASQLTSWKGRTLAHDANGNLESDGLRTYTWDARGNLTRVSDSLASLAEFAYEPAGRRMRKSVAGVTTDYLYSGTNIIQEQRGGSTTRLLTGLGMDEVFSRTTSTGSRDYFTDVLGSTVALVDATGALTAEYTYAPYGATAHTGDAVGNTQAFIGREDDGTGLYYFRARYYDPDMSRFLQPESMATDPEWVRAQVMAGLSAPVYGYALNNPLGFVDPDGNEAIISGISIGVGAGGGSTAGVGGAIGAGGGAAAVGIAGVLGFGVGYGICTLTGNPYCNPFTWFPRDTPVKPVAEPVCREGDGDDELSKDGRKPLSQCLDACAASRRSGFPHAWRRFCDKISDIQLRMICHANENSSQSACNNWCYNYFGN